MNHHDVFRRLRLHYSGLLSIGDRFEPVLFIIDSVSGLPVMPCDPDALLEEMVVLHVPDDSDPLGLSLLATVTEADPATHNAPMRHAAYFGPTQARRWLILGVESVKLGGSVISGEDAVAPNPLAKFESALCRRLNEDRSLLASLARVASAGKGTNEPMVVGVDDLGIDIRARFGIMRVDFPSPITDPDAAHAAFLALAGRAP
ncbi:MAG: hypothetical protein JSR77_05085 [Planctomycetes bacterium]|nr:hypothetical protein [Planctomycetota bacterium]